MEQPDLFPPEEVKSQTKPAEVVDMGEFIAPTVSAAEEIIYCGECNTPRPKGQRRCPGCNVYGK